jgi:hypothetical protein
MPHQRRIHFSGLPLIRQGELRGLIPIIENLKCVSDSFGRLPLGTLSSGSPWQAGCPIIISEKLKWEIGIEI